MKSKVSITNTPNDTPLHLTMVIPSLELNAEYLSRFNVDWIMRNEITLLNESHTVDLTTWQVEASPLWRFNLHYFEYAIALAARFSQTTDRKYFDKFKELLGSWMAANPAGIGDGWHPYTISMRIPNLLICFDLFGKAFENDVEFREKAVGNIYTQYRTLMKRKELWQLGNHYFENLKTILLGSLVFGEAGVFTKYIQLFLREVKEEILTDGVHFELSPMYHKNILEDNIRVAYWLQQAEKSQYKELLPVIQRMVDALASIEKGMGRTPLFNDSGDGVAKDGGALLLAANELFNIAPNYSMSFPASGYYKLYDGNISLMFDAGEIGPKYMTGHSHCDCLSFELSVDNKPIFVNSGTYQYQGSKRKYFRSTEAHNTLTIGEREQSECWGEHRVARRIGNVKAEKHNQMITGSYYTYLGDKHMRMISLAEGELIVLDLVNTKVLTTIHSYLHIANNYEVFTDKASIKVLFDAKKVCTIMPVGAEYSIHTSGSLTNYAPRFGTLSQGICIEFRWQADDMQHGYIIKVS
ncbi:heparinase II/III domain-containing protein [Sphaerochaeta sp.]|uniref:heparinase II/III domain-containing protein n=1 Tax=Sphaerochaeta sp. TaxID=1972642 RepID=UPI003D0B0B4E